MKRLFVVLFALGLFVLAPLLIVGVPALVHAASAASPWGVDDKDFSILMPDALVAKARVAQRVPALESAAAKGDANAAVLLGVARLYGLGVPKNESSAAQLIRQAAQAGHPRGMGGWAAILGQGLAGVPANPALARDWARRGAEAGNAVAMMNLAQALEQGTGGAVDRAAAAQWTRRSAELGNAWGMTGWGELLRNGRAASAGDAGLERNPAQAAIWFHRAAESGVASAMNNLGLMLADGNGVVQNFGESERWLRAALNAGESYALGNLIHMLQRQVQAAKPDDGAKRILLLRFTSSACAACRKADSAWNSPAFQDWLNARAKHLSIDIDKEAALAKKLGVTPEMMVKTYDAGTNGKFSFTEPLVLIYKKDKQPQMVRVQSGTPQSSLEVYLRESEYKSVWADRKPYVPPEVPGFEDSLGRILDEAAKANKEKQSAPASPSPASPVIPRGDLSDPYRLAWLASYCHAETVWAGNARQQEQQWQRLFEAGLFWSVFYERSLRTLSFDAVNPPAGFDSCAAELPRVLREFETLDTMYGQGWQTGAKTAKTPPARTARNEAFYEARWCEAVSNSHLGLISMEDKDKSYRRNVSDFLQWWSQRAASLSRPAGAGGLTGTEADMLSNMEQRVREDFQEYQRILGPTPQRKSVWPRFIMGESSRHCGNTLLALKLGGG